MFVCFFRFFFFFGGGGGGREEEEKKKKKKSNNHKSNTGGTFENKKRKKKKKKKRTRNGLAPVASVDGPGSIFAPWRPGSFACGVTLRSVSWQSPTLLVLT